MRIKPQAILLDAHQTSGSITRRASSLGLYDPKSIKLDDTRRASSLMRIWSFESWLLVPHATSQDAGKNMVSSRARAVDRG